jgi:hypothetical protein
MIYPIHDGECGGAECKRDNCSAAEHFHVVPQFTQPSFAARLHGRVIGYYATAEEADTALVVAINAEAES